MEKWNEETGVLEYKGISNSTYLGNELFAIGEKEYYLDEAVEFDVKSAIGKPEPLHEMIYHKNISVENYNNSLEWMDVKEQWAFIDDSGNISICDKGFEFNKSVEIPVQDPKGLHYDENEDVFYTMNGTDQSLKTRVWKFNMSGGLEDEYNITNQEDNRYNFVRGIESHNGSFYILGSLDDENGTVFDRYNESFGFSERVAKNITLSSEYPLRPGDIHRHSDYWWYIADKDIHAFDDNFERVSYEGHPDNYWSWQILEDGTDAWGIAHNGTSWHICSRKTDNASEIQLTDRGVKEFEYQVRDYLSEEVLSSSHHDTDGFVSNFSFYGLADREYLIKLHKKESALIINQHIKDIRDDWKEETQEMNVTVDMAEEWRRVSGYVDNDGSYDFTNISAVYYEIDERNKADLTGGYNRGRLVDKPDVYKPEEGYYDIGIPKPAKYDSTYLIYITAYDQSEDQHYGAVKDITLKSGEGNITGMNLTLEPLLGEESELIAHGVSEEGQNAKVTTALKKFQFVDSASGEKIIPESYNSEIHMDYTDYWPDSTEVVWTRDSGNHSTNAEVDHFELPVFGKEGSRLNSFVYDHKPRSIIRLTEEKLDVDDTFNVTVFEGDLEDTFIGGETGDIEISIFRGDDADSPYPDDSNLIYSSNETGFDNSREELEFVNKLLKILGGNMSFRISTENISVHYSNVDVSKSGSPDAIFSSGAEIKGTFDSLWKFGSTGPDIYDEVLISMPYDESNEENTTVHIPYLYDEEDWENPIWNASAGDNITDIKTDPDLRYYRDGYVDTEYEAYLNGTGVTCIENNKKLSEGIGHKDTANQTIWLEIPHFSGVGLNVEGEATKESNLEVEIDSPEDGAEYKEGKNVTIKYNITNTGNIEDTQDVVLQIDDEMEKVKTNVTLEEGDIYVDKFNWTAAEPYGNRTLSVYTDDDHDETTIAVLETHILTIESTDGKGSLYLEGEEINVFEHTETFLDGEQVELEASPEEGWNFVGWEGDHTSQEKKITMVMDENKSIKAVFEERMDEAYFRVEITEIKDGVVEGEEITIEYMVNNTGEVEGVQDIIITIGGGRLCSRREFVSRGKKRIPRRIQMDSRRSRGLFCNYKERGRGI